ncbi:hypothetical protein ABZ477_14770 [Microbacterium sp. NPDC019599]
MNATSEWMPTHSRAAQTEDLLLIGDAQIPVQEPGRRRRPT